MKIDKYYKKINLVEGERIIDVIKQHPLSKTHLILIAVILFLVPIFFMYYLFSLGNLGVTIYISILLLAVYFSIREYIVWTNNVFILTNKKIVDINQRGFFTKIVSEVSYKKVLDVSYITKGIINYIFGFGSIIVKTSVPGLSLKIEYVGNVKNKNGQIIELVEKGGGIIVDEDLSAQEKEKNFEDFMDQDDLAGYDEYSLKDLIEEYTETYSVQRLKKLLINDLKDDD